MNFLKKIFFWIFLAVFVAVVSQHFEHFNYLFVVIYQNLLFVVNVFRKQKIL